MVNSPYYTTQHEKDTRKKRKGVRYMDKNIPKLVMVSDMASRWGKDRRVIHNWKERDPSFPSPVMIVGCGNYPLFLESDMIEYGKSKGVEKE